MKINKSRWMIAILLAACVLSVSGCKDKKEQADATKIVLTTGFGQDEVFRIDRLSCTLPEIMVYLTNMKNQYESVYGDRIWEASYEGETLEDNIKETVLARVAKIKAMNLLAQQKEIALDGEELDKTARAAAQYYESVSYTHLSGSSADSFSESGDLWRSELQGTAGSGKREQFY